MNMTGRAIPRKLLAAGAMLLLAAGCVSVAAETAVPASAASASITVNGTQGGRTFDGIGAISGGGGNSGCWATTRPRSSSRSSTTCSSPATGRTCRS